MLRMQILRKCGLFSTSQLLKFFRLKLFRGVAQGLARLLREQEVGGSIPLAPTITKADISGKESKRTDDFQGEWGRNPPT